MLSIFLQLTGYTCHSIEHLTRPDLLNKFATVTLENMKYGTFTEQERCNVQYLDIKVVLDYCTPETN